MKKIAFSAALLFFVLCGVAQTGGLRVAAGIRLPEDPVVRVELMGGLNGWLAAVAGPDSLNRYVAEGDRPATAVLMGQLRALKGDCWLGGVTALDSGHWQIRLNYMSVAKDTPSLLACCTVLARREGDKWIVSSVLGRATTDWKTRAIGNCVFHHKKIGRASCRERV